MTILWQQKNWICNPPIGPRLRDESRLLEEMEARVIAISGQEELEKLLARSLEDELRASSGIEGVRMDSLKIRSSIARNKGWIQAAWEPGCQESGKEARAVRAAISLMESGDSLDRKILCACHALLAPAAENGWGAFREHPESVYDENGSLVYDAPDSPEMRLFLDEFIAWWNGARLELPLAVGSALGHLYFETIHPFHDGNGRIGRMFADKAWAKRHIQIIQRIGGYCLRQKSLL